jgi:hypothetical protein
LDGAGIWDVNGNVNVEVGRGSSVLMVGERRGVADSTFGLIERRYPKCRELNTYAEFFDYRSIIFLSFSPHYLQ